MPLKKNSPNLIGQTVTFITKDANTGISTRHERLIQYIIKDGKKKYYHWVDLESGEEGTANKDIYDKMFFVAKTNIMPPTYRGENQNIRVKLTERVTVSRSNSKRYGR